MSEAVLHRLTLLEQRMELLQSEINEVLTEVQMAMTGMSRANKMAFEVMHARLEALESQCKVVIRQDEGGKEL